MPLYSGLTDGQKALLAVLIADLGTLEPRLEDVRRIHCWELEEGLKTPVEIIRLLGPRVEELKEQVRLEPYGTEKWDELNARSSCSSPC